MYNHMKKADNFDAGKWLVENKITTQSRLNEETDNTVDILYNKIIDYMDNNYSSNDIVEDDIYTILNDVLKVEYTPEIFQKILNKIKTESEYSFED